jgi:hypothetical protein
MTLIRSTFKAKDKLKANLGVPKAKKKLATSTAAAAGLLFGVDVATAVANSRAIDARHGNAAVAAASGNHFREVLVDTAVVTVDGINGGIIAADAVALPSVFVACVEYILAHGIDEEGVFRCVTIDLLLSALICSVFVVFCRLFLFCTATRFDAHSLPCHFISFHSI